MNIHSLPGFLTPTSPLAAAIPVTGRCLQEELRGKTPAERAHLGAQLVAGMLALTWPTVPMAGRLVCTSSQLIHRALGHPVRPPCPADMVSYISRFGIERTEALIVQIRAVTVNQGGAS